MSDRTPWWYSGDGSKEPVEPHEPVEPNDAKEPVEPYQDAQPGGASSDGPEPGDSAPVDWMGLLAGAARMVDWATSAVLTPHAEHADPAEHPQCVVCRAILLVGDRGAAVAEEPRDAAPAPRIRWIPVVDEPGT